MPHSVGSMLGFLRRKKPRTHRDSGSGHGPSQA